MQQDGGIHKSHTQLGRPIPFETTMTSNRSMAAQQMEFSIHSCALTVALGRISCVPNAQQRTDIARIEPMQMMFTTHDRFEEFSVVFAQWIQWTHLSVSLFYRFADALEFSIRGSRIVHGRQGVKVRLICTKTYCGIMKHIGNALSQRRAIGVSYYKHLMKLELVPR